MENPDDKRGHEVIKQPQNLEDARKMLKQVEKLMNEFRIVSPNMAGNFNEGFSYWTIPPNNQPEGPELPEGPQTPEQ